MSPPMTVGLAARELGISKAQLWRWIAQGAPVVRERRPMLVDVAELQRWRQGANGDVLGKLETALLDVMRRDAGIDGRTAAAMIGIDDARAAALLLAAYDRACVAITGREPREPFSPAINALRTIAAAKSHDMRLQAR